jgi:DNA-binding XRE family transcriptional regulator
MNLLMEYSGYILSFEMATPSHATTRLEPDAPRVLSRAMLRAAEVLEIPQTQLADVIGVSAPTMSRIANGLKMLDPDSKAWQLAALFVRLFRSLDAIVGSDDEAARAWVRGENRALGGVPLDLIYDPAGLVRTVDYLDAARARI